MSISNGVNKGSETEDTETVDFVRRSTESLQNNSEEAFHGFEKVPLVVLQRCDITPYLNLEDNKSKDVEEDSTDNNSLTVHSMRLAQKCSVNIFRDDLEKLRTRLLRQDRKLSTGSLSDSGDEKNDKMFSNIKCNICEKKYSSRKKLRKHQANKHMIVYQSNDKPQKKVSFSEHVIIHEVKEYHKCRKCPKIFEAYNLLKTHMKLQHKKQKLKIGGKVLTDAVEFIDVQSFDVNNGEIKRAIVDPKSKKTIISKHQCQTCGKYYSSSYCLNRHIETQHSDYDSLRCKVCEETFVWPSLLKSHKCIRLSYPEMPFEDARPEIHFDNLHQIGSTGFDDIMVDSDDYMNNVDFEIPAPIVELTEYNNSSPVMAENKFASLSNLGYKLVMQEVPIEF